MAAMEVSSVTCSRLAARRKNVFLPHWDSALFHQPSARWWHLCFRLVRSIARSSVNALMTRLVARLWLRWNLLVGTVLSPGIPLLLMYLSVNTLGHLGQLGQLDAQLKLGFGYRSPTSVNSKTNFGHRS